MTPPSAVVFVPVSEKSRSPKVFTFADVDASGWYDIVVPQGWIQGNRRQFPE